MSVEVSIYVSLRYPSRHILRQKSRSILEEIKGDGRVYGDGRPCDGGRGRFTGGTASCGGLFY